MSNLKNPQKYIGDLSNITYRSIWERNLMRWLDENPNVREWGSEEFSIPYDNPIKGRAKYYPDFFIVWESGAMMVVEVKPKNQTVPPIQPKRKTQRYITEVATYAINQEKWKAAKSFCDRNNLKFEVWTEDDLTRLGVSTSATGAQRKQLAERAKPKMVPMVRERRPRPTRRS